MTIIQLIAKLLLYVGRNDHSMVLDQLKQRWNDKSCANEAASDYKPTVVQKIVFWDYNGVCVKNLAMGIVDGCTIIFGEDSPVD